MEGTISTTYRQPPEIIDTEAGYSSIRENIINSKYIYIYIVNNKSDDFYQIHFELYQLEEEYLEYNY